MTDSNLILLLATFSGGLFAGVLLTLLFNKVRSGSATPASVKREMEDYQQKVESHFDETSDKFKAMAEQYKDLYEHLSVGATSLCRPDHVVPGLSQASDPLQETRKKIENKPSNPQPDNAGNKSKQVNSSSQKQAAAKTSSENTVEKSASDKKIDQSAADSKKKANVSATTSTNTKEAKEPINSAKDKDREPKK